MPAPFVTTDISGQLIMLGTGTSVGVPTIGCGCAVCQSGDPKNQRTRSSVILGLPEGNLLIDTTPDLRHQLLRERIGVVHAVLYTHEHTDHMMGMDDLRLFPFYLGHPVPLYCEPKVQRRIEQAFEYAFNAEKPTHEGAVPQVRFQNLSLDPLELLGVKITPIRLLHGPRFVVLGFRIGRIAYCTDTSAIPAESWELLQDLDLLILDALRNRPHLTHFSLEQAVEVGQRCGAKRVLFTHISHELDHHATNATLPAHMALAYDGQRINLS